MLVDARVLKGGGGGGGGVDGDGSVMCMIKKVEFGGGGVDGDHEVWWW
jgi:hypothetical protein